MVRENDRAGHQLLASAAFAGKLILAYTRIFQARNHGKHILGIAYGPMLPRGFLGLTRSGRECVFWGPAAFAAMRLNAAEFFQRNGLSM